MYDERRRNGELAAAREIGMKEGMEKGREEGREEGRDAKALEIAMALKAKGMSAAEIAAVVGIPEDRILASGTLTPPSL